MRPDPCLFVCGCGRSGTTLIRNMLNAHPSLAVPGEGQFVVSCLEALVAEGTPGDLPRAWELISRRGDFRRWGLGSDAVAAEVADVAPASYADLIRALFAAYARTRGKPRTADKTPANVYRIPLLAQMFPTARVARVLRDPRDVAMSMSLQHFVTGGLARAAVIWRNAARSGRAGRERVKADRVFDVRYEDLVADPAGQIGRLLENASLPFDAAVLAHERSEDNIAGAEHELASGRVVRIRSWREEMSIDQVAVVELVAGDEMESEGYGRVAGTRALMRALPEVLRERGWNYLRGRLRDRWGPAPAPALDAVPGGPVIPLTPAVISDRAPADAPPPTAAR